MKENDFLFSFAVLAVVLAIGLACSSLRSGDREITRSPTANATPSTNPSVGNTASANVEKADFTVTAEDLDKEFTRKGVRRDDLAKYANKNIAVTGRVSMLVTEKKGTVQPWVTLFAPGALHGVSCYFDDENISQLKLLKEEKTVTVQGFQDNFIVPEVSPRLKHCVVVSAGA